MKEREETPQQTACLAQSSAPHHQSHTNDIYCWRHLILAINIHGKDNVEIIFINVLLYIMYSIRVGKKENPHTHVK